MIACDRISNSFDTLWMSLLAARKKIKDPIKNEGAGMATLYVNFSDAQGQIEDYHANRTTYLLFCTTSETEGEDVHVKLV